MGDQAEIYDISYMASLLKAKIRNQDTVDRFKIRDLSQKYRYRVESHAFDHEESKYDIYFALRPREPFPQRA